MNNTFRDLINQINKEEKKTSAPRPVAKAPPAAKEATIETVADLLKKNSKDVEGLKNVLNRKAATAKSARKKTKSTAPKEVRDIDKNIKENLKQTKQLVRSVGFLLDATRRIEKTEKSLLTVSRRSEKVQKTTNGLLKNMIGFLQKTNVKMNGLDKLANSIKNMKMPKMSAPVVNNKVNTKVNVAAPSFGQLNVLDKIEANTNTTVRLLSVIAKMMGQMSAAQRKMAAMNQHNTSTNPLNVQTGGGNNTNTGGKNSGNSSSGGGGFFSGLLGNLLGGAGGLLKGIGGGLFGFIRSFGRIAKFLVKRVLFPFIAVDGLKTFLEVFYESQDLKNALLEGMRTMMKDFTFGFLNETIDKVIDKLKEEDGITKLVTAVGEKIKEILGSVFDYLSQKLNDGVITPALEAYEKIKNMLNNNVVNPVKDKAKELFVPQYEDVPMTKFPPNTAIGDSKAKARMAEILNTPELTDGQKQELDIRSNQHHKMQGAYNQQKKPQTSVTVPIPPLSKEDSLDGASRYLDKFFTTPKKTAEQYAKDIAIEREGFIPGIKEDLSKKGSVTGYGHLLSKEELRDKKIVLDDGTVINLNDGISEKDAKKLFEQDWKNNSSEAKNKLTAKGVDFSRLDAKTKAVLSEMAYNMGPNIFDETPKLIEALKANDKEGIRREISDVGLKAGVKGQKKSFRGLSIRVQKRLNMLDKNDTDFADAIEHESSNLGLMKNGPQSMAPVVINNQQQVAAGTAGVTSVAGNKNDRESARNFGAYDGLDFVNRTDILGGLV